MQDDVERVRKAVKHAVAIWLRTLSDHRERSDVEARAAMAATREIDAEALRNVAEEWPYLSAQENKRRETMLSIAADWLQQRANDVKETE